MWAISAMDRANGNELSALDLPAEPILSGICINRDRQVLIVLRDGSLVCYGIK
jgi:hypothetical protein